MTREEVKQQIENTKIGKSLCIADDTYIEFVIDKESNGKYNVKLYYCDEFIVDEEKANADRIIEMIDTECVNYEKIEISRFEKRSDN